MKSRTPSTYPLQPVPAVLREAQESPSLRVIDPQVGAYFVPWSKIQETRGCADARAKSRNISLCMLFQKGSCRAGGSCHQLHVEVEYISELRKLHQENDDCCLEHGDINSHIQTFIDVLRPELKTKLNLYGKKSGQTLYVPRSQVARTMYIENLLGDIKGGTERQISLPLDRICGLHQRKRCLYGQDCKSIHLCRQLWTAFLDEYKWLWQENDLRKQKHLSVTMAAHGTTGKHKVIEEDHDDEKLNRFSNDAKNNKQSNTNDNNKWADTPKSKSFSISQNKTSKQYKENGLRSNNNNNNNSIISESKDVNNNSDTKTRQPKKSEENRNPSNSNTTSTDQNIKQNGFSPTTPSPHIMSPSMCCPHYSLPAPHPSLTYLPYYCPHMSHPQWNPYEHDPRVPPWFPYPYPRMPASPPRDQISMPPRALACEEQQTAYEHNPYYSPPWTNYYSSYSDPRYHRMPPWALPKHDNEPENTSKETYTNVGRERPDHSPLKGNDSPKELKFYEGESENGGALKT